MNDLVFNVLRILGITSPILFLIGLMIYVLLKKMLEDRFDILKSEEIEGVKHKLAKDIRLFENEKEALSGVLQAISNVIIQVKSSYIVSVDEFRVISESRCDDLELELSRYVLYVDRDSQDLISLAIKILRKNSSWLYDVTGDHDDLYFNL
ncbi:hypothetical protein [Chlorobium sp. KB01]|uniref:hypothetical protein n=1 Tax=Chlorobium sp. KB01 TaxID=1917528 RepID=UPI0009785C56|nr:hypothetical protein [Chlorobium sp. KB01]